MNGIGENLRGIEEMFGMKVAELFYPTFDVKRSGSSLSAAKDRSCAVQGAIR